VLNSFDYSKEGKRMSTNIFKDNKTIVAGVTTGVIVVLATLLLQDVHSWLRNRITTGACVTFGTATRRQNKDGTYLINYLLYVNNNAVTYRSFAKLVISDTARDIVLVETSDIIAPHTEPSNTPTHIIDLSRKPQRQVIIDIQMPPQRVMCMFNVAVISKEANSDDSTLQVKLCHEGGLYDLKMPKLQW
jgi:hypothetical protein